MENLYELLEEAAHKVPTKGIVIVNNSQCDLFLTYSELREKSRKIAFILKSYYQVKPVSKIIISVEKSENFILLFWGCVMAGCIPVLMPSVQFSNKNSIAFERLKNAIDILGVVTLITNDINLFEYYKSSFHKAVCVEDIMKQLDLLQDYSLHIPKRDSKDLCVIQFSSGSTGAPKGVMLSFNNILTNLKIKTLADEITTEDTLIHWMPYFHDYGLFGNHLVCLYNQITEINIAKVECKKLSSIRIFEETHSIFYKVNETYKNESKMKRVMILSFAAALLATGCTSKSTVKTPGIDLSNLDTTVACGDDF